MKKTYSQTGHIVGPETLAFRHLKRNSPVAQPAAYRPILACVGCREAYSTPRVARNPSVTPRLRDATGREIAADLFLRRGIEAVPQLSVPLYCLWPEPHHFTRILLRHCNPTHLLVGLLSPLRRQLRGESDSFWKAGERRFLSYFCLKFSTVLL